ncbi:MAG: PKD repeat protein, partial [Flavobacteriales bacterium]
MQYIFKLLYTILFIFIIDVATAQTITVNSNPICNDNRLTTFSVDGTYDLSTQVLTWDLDEGSFADSTTIAQVLYLIDGEKTVTFFVDNVPKATKTVYVYSVKPDLYLDKITGCEPVDITYTTDFVTFEANAVLPDVQVSSVDLVLGDGARRTLTPAGYTHSYIAGEYEPSIIVTDELGCIGRVSKNIVIDPKPEAIIVTDPIVASSCDKPFTVIFSDGSDSRNQANVSSWQWNFGQGQTSNQAGPTSITYVNDGSYSVSLTVTNSNGCKDTDNLSVSLGSPKANFILEGVFSQDTLCGKVTFVNQSSTSEVFWDFSALGISNPYKGKSGFELDLIALLPGTYPITIKAEVVNNNVTCEATFTKNIVIPEIKADFDVSPNYGCEFPFDVRFDDNSINADTYKWIYGNGLDSIFVGNGSHDYTYDQEDLYEYSRKGMNAWYPYLKVTNKYGCRDSTRRGSVPVDSVKVFEPWARFMPDTMDGCAPLSVFFMDSINVDVDNNDVTSFTWDFGDGNIVTGPSLTQITHVYPNPGIYYVKLSITTALGCSDDSYLIPIRVGQPASGHLKIVMSVPDGSSICPGQRVDVDLVGNPTPAFDMLQINASSEDLSSCFNDFNVDYNNVGFEHTVGPITLDVTGIIDGCYTTTPTQDVKTLNMLGPIVRNMGYN